MAMVSDALVEKAREFHGHICPFVVLGLRASEIAMQKLGLEKASEAETVGEDILVIVECNNCLVDGVQVATGCTLGNNSLLYLDVGKNAVTIVKRRDWSGVRVYVDSEKLRNTYFSDEATALFDKVVVKRQGTEGDSKRLQKIWTELGRSMANAPEELFKIDFVKVAEIERAPIFDSIKCERCGELAMKTRVRMVDGKSVCLSCIGDCEAVIGRGIVSNFKFPLTWRK